LRVLNHEVADAGVAVLKSQLRADSLKIRLEHLNTALEGARDSLKAYDRRAARGRLGPAEYAQYRRRVDAYNRRVAEQNQSLNDLLNELQQAITVNRHAVRRYNHLAERIRTLAAAMGEVHYNIPSPVEAAVRTGLRPE
jgi:chromosome segregation ATPase